MRNDRQILNVSFGYRQSTVSKIQFATADQSGACSLVGAKLIHPPARFTGAVPSATPPPSHCARTAARPGATCRLRKELK